jgi:hypothetical protein
MSFLASAKPLNVCWSLVLISVVGVAAFPAALQNITFTVPEGTTNHGDDHLLCTPTVWTDVVVFFLGNYLAHAATIKTNPGESPQSVTTAIIAALLFPTAGIARGLRAIYSLAKYGKTDLHVAARARALCMLTRAGDWEPRHGEEISNVVLSSKKPVTEACTSLSQRLVAKS